MEPNHPVDATPAVEEGNHQLPEPNANLANAATILMDYYGYSRVRVPSMTLAVIHFPSASPLSSANRRGNGPLPPQDESRPRILLAVADPHLHRTNFFEEFANAAEEEAAAAADMLPPFVSPSEPRSSVGDLNSSGTPSTHHPSSLPSTMDFRADSRERQDGASATIPAQGSGNDSHLSVPQRLRGLAAQLRAAWSEGPPEVSEEEQADADGVPAESSAFHSVVFIETV